MVSELKYMYVAQAQIPSKSTINVLKHNVAFVKTFWAIYENYSLGK